MIKCDCSNKFEPKDSDCEPWVEYKNMFLVECKGCRTSLWVTKGADGKFKRPTFKEIKAAKIKK